MNLGKGLKLGKGAISAIVAGVVVVIFIIVGVSVAGSVHNSGTRQENAIVALNNSNTIQLNQYVASLKEQVGIANLKSQQLDTVLKDAVSSQFSQSQLSDPQAKGSLFSALTEAYPTIDLSIYDKIETFVQGQRQDYALLQKQLQDMLQQFNNWRESWPNSWFAGGYPNSILTCQNDSGTTLTGQACLTYLETISQPNGSNNGGGQTAITIPGLNGH